MTPSAWKNGGAGAVIRWAVVDTSLGQMLVAATEKADKIYTQGNFKTPVAIVMGSEESGITSDLLNMADIKARIPMKGEIASLNVGVAAGMVFYERTRQEIRG